MRNGTVVTTTGGAVAGVIEGSVRRYSGIPFARVPARFRRPVPAAWDGVFDATHWGPAPWQPVPGWDDPAAPFDEDCLNLVVWAPVEITTPLPVLVWVYGGGFEQGSNASPMTRGDALTAHGDMIVVALNYRVAALGWAELAHLGGPLGEASNLGLHDILAGLEWVRENIGSFGGDADDVTVMGESAGSFALCALLGAPRAAPLFSAMAAFSGCASRIVPLDAAQELGEQMLEALDTDPLTSTPEQWIAAQRRVTSFEIGERNSVRPRTLGVVDDRRSPDGLLSALPLDAVRAGTWGDRRLLVGSTRDEAAVFPQPDDLTPESLRAELQTWTGDPRAVAVMDAYLGETADLVDLRRRVITDWIYRLPSVRLADAVAAAGGRAYLAMTGRVDGQPARHAVDVPGLLGRSLPTDSPEAVRRAGEITDAIRRFVRDDMDWSPVLSATGTPPARSFGDPLFDAGSAYELVRDRWDGIVRP